MRLIERSGRSLELTETGKLLFAQTSGPMRDIEEAVRAAREGLTAPEDTFALRRRCCFHKSRWGCWLRGSSHAPRGADQKSSQRTV